MAADKEDVVVSSGVMWGGECVISYHVIFFITGRLYAQEQSTHACTLTK